MVIQANHLPDFFCCLTKILYLLKKENKCLDTAAMLHNSREHPCCVKWQPSDQDMCSLIPTAPTTKYFLTPVTHIYVLCFRGIYTASLLTPLPIFPSILYSLNIFKHLLCAKHYIRH